MSYRELTLNDWKDGQLLLINKPKSWTSFDVVNKIRYTLKKHLSIKKIKVGHAGTLDPLATGLLIIAVGRETKKIQELQGLNKTYTGYLAIGGSTPSADLETEIIHDSPYQGSVNDLNQIAQELTGSIMQQPPLFSAKKLDGKRAYLLAREGSKKELPAKEVIVNAFDILAERPSKNDRIREFEFHVACSKGTYIRSLARDLGDKVACGGFLTSLKRESIGYHHLSDAWDLDEWLTFFD